MFSPTSTLSSASELIVMGSLFVQGRWSFEDTLLLNSGTIVFENGSVYNFVNVELNSAMVSLFTIPYQMNYLSLIQSTLSIADIDHELFILSVDSIDSDMYVDSISGQFEIFNFSSSSSNFLLNDCPPFFVIRYLTNTVHSNWTLASGTLSVVEVLNNNVGSVFDGTDPVIFLNIDVLEAEIFDDTCCSTFECHVSVYFTHIQKVKDFELFRSLGSGDPSYEILLDRFQFLFRNNFGVNSLLHNFNSISQSMTSSSLWTSLSPYVPSMSPTYPPPSLMALN
ncbi:hypothetical protein GEMRC1_004512 [Eukaryota sp. GEM-RC1]